MRLESACMTVELLGSCYQAFSRQTSSADLFSTHAYALHVAQVVCGGSDEHVVKALTCMSGLVHSCSNAHSAVGLEGFPGTAGDGKNTNVGNDPVASSGGQRLASLSLPGLWQPWKWCCLLSSTPVCIVTCIPQLLTGNAPIAEYVVPQDKGVEVSQPQQTTCAGNLSHNTIQPMNRRLFSTPAPTACRSHVAVARSCSLWVAALHIYLARCTPLHLPSVCCQMSGSLTCSLRTAAACTVCLISGHVCPAQAKNQAIDREYDAQKDIAKPFTKGKVEGEARWAMVLISQHGCQTEYVWCPTA